MKENTFDKFAEESVFALEVRRAEKNGLREPRKMNTKMNNGKVQCGYDIDSEDRQLKFKTIIYRKNVSNSLYSNL